MSQLDPSSESFLFDLSRTTQRLDRAQREITSGKRVSSVSDAPDQISALLQARSSLATNSQISLDLSRVKTEVDSAESAMAAAVTVVDRARVSGLQGATGTATDESRKTIADGLGDVLDQLIAITRTNVEGRFIFSGDSDQAEPYTLDLTQANPVSAYLGSASSRKVLDLRETLFAWPAPRNRSSTARWHRRVSSDPSARCEPHCWQTIRLESPRRWATCDPPGTISTRSMRSTAASKAR
jgi:Flagellin and related hook-associated proteins